MAETDDLHQTRASRRSGRHEAPARRAAIAPALTSETRVLEVLSTVLFGLLLVLTALAGPYFVAATVLLGVALVAWGWPHLLGSPSPRGSSAVIVAAGLMLAVAVLARDAGPYLRHVPAAVAAAILLMFLHQLLRKDGRPRLTQSLAITAGALMTVTAGTAYVPLPETPTGPEPVAAAGLAAAAAALVDLYAGRPAFRAWLLPVAMLLGVVGGAVVAAAGDTMTLAPAALIGALVGGIGHAVRRVLGTQPRIGAVPSQLASATSSVLVPGLVVYTVARVLVG